MNTPTIQHVRELISEGRMTRSGLARAAGLHANTLRDCTEDSWNPTADTLGKLERFLSSNDDSPVLVPIEQIIDEARNGRMFVLVDDEDRENEGDLIIPAQMATPDAINFMATYGRGLICLALAPNRVEALGLQPMTRTNRSRMETAFTTSIEAREGISTGISAADRARTVSVAIDAAKGPEDIVSPGHVFPLVAREGGVLVRAGHTEAAVDVARLAGLNPSGVICEIMAEDGSMARLDDILRFARLHGLKVGTIRDLIAYRRRHDHLVEKRSEGRFTSRWGGDWRAIGFYNKATRGETMALVKGHIDPAKPTLVRMHALSVFDDVFARDTERQGLLEGAMRIIGEHGAGVVVLINSPAGDHASSAIRGLDRTQSSDDAGMPAEQRDYGVGAQILAELGVHDMVLLTNTRHSLVGLEGYDLSIVGERPIDPAMIPQIRGLDTETGDPKYARLELERRWLVDTAARPALEGGWTTLIEDRYIDGSRMRLRRMSRPDLGEVKWKLTKKYECADPAARPIVTSYLTAAEYDLLAALPAQPLRKVRHHLPLDGLWWSLDLFEGALAGLEVVEIEAADEAALAALVPPVWAAKEVTRDPRYQCGSLAQTNLIPE